MSTTANSTSQAAALERQALVDWYDSTITHLGNPALASVHEQVRAEAARIGALIAAHDNAQRV